MNHQMNIDEAIAIAIVTKTSNQMLFKKTNNFPRR